MCLAGKTLLVFLFLNKFFSFKASCFLWLTWTAAKIEIIQHLYWRTDAHEDA